MNVIIELSSGKQITIKNFRYPYLKFLPKGINYSDVIMLRFEKSYEIFPISQSLLEQLNNLQYLIIVGGSLKFIPNYISCAKSLLELTVIGTKIRSLPPTLVDMVNLLKLDVSHNSNLRHLNPVFPNIGLVNLTNCPHLTNAIMKVIEDFQCKNIQNCMLSRDLYCLVCATLQKVGT